MKIMLVTEQREKYPNSKVHDHYYMLPLLEKGVEPMGVVLKKDQTLFYLRYIKTNTSSFKVFSWRVVSGIYFDILS